MKKKWLFGVLAVSTLLSGAMLAACTEQEPTPPPPDDTTVPTKIADAADMQVDLYGEDLLKDERKVSYTLTDYVKDANAAGVTYRLTSTSEGLKVGQVKNNRFEVTVSTVGEKSFALEVSQNNEVCFNVQAKVNVTDSSAYNIANGGFETGDLTGWTAGGALQYAVAENLTYFDFLDPVPTVNHDGDYYLDGYNQANGFSAESANGTLTSSTFTVGGSRYISFKLGGGAHKSLKVELLEKTATGEEPIATFNNYKFSDPYRSIGLTEYVYQIPEKYAGKTCFIRLTDNAKSGSFQALTADSFRMYYPEGQEPQIDDENVFAAGYSGDIMKETLGIDDATRTLPNGDFETGDLTGWTGDSLFALSDRQTFFDDIFPDNVPKYNQQGTWFVTSEGDIDATGTLTSKAFVVEGSRYITFRLGGNKTENLYVSLMHYVEGGDDEEIAKFNNNQFSDPYRSFAMTKYAYRISEDYAGEKCYFVLHDGATSETTFGVLTADEFVTYYAAGEEPVIDGVNIFLAGYREAAITDLESKLGLDTATNELRNGDFETGDMTGWFTADLEGIYTVAEEGTFFENFFPLNVPIYAVDGTYFLSGCQLGVDERGLGAVGSVYSQAFIVGGTGWITFKMGGTNDESIKLELIRFVADGEDEVIATFNNYLFSDPYRSMGMTTYAYRIAETYMGEKCYFKLTDRAGTEIPFGAATLDSVKTYYTTEVQVYDGLPMAITNEATSQKLSADTNVYPAAYVRVPVSGIGDKLGLDTATYQIRNGGFETGDHTGWFTDASGYTSYKISNESTYFGQFYPDNVPVYNKEGEYFLDGYGNEGYTGEIYSQAFKVGGTRWITFRLGGNKTEGLKVKLMKYVDGVADEEIAVFNNYLFSDPYRSFGMTKYAYQVPEEYAEALCYFVISDENGGPNFNAITADDFVTYYETAPVLYYGTASSTNIDDGRIYPAGYMTAS